MPFIPSLRLLLPLLMVASWSRISLAAQDTVPWAVADFQKAPPIEDTTDEAQPGLRSLYYEGAAYDGSPTSVYAYYGVPEGSPPDGGWPGVVLLHGGGGTAYPEWVHRWNAAGFAAIAMDLEGHQPGSAHTPTPRPGPNQKGNPADTLFADQFIYHAVADGMLANSLLRSFPEINPEKVGVCGVSWGGVWTCILSGLDHRFAFAIPIYGCGFLNESTGLVHTLSRLPWDPSLFLPQAGCPLLFVNGTNDKNFPPPVWQKSVDAGVAPAQELFLPGLSHSHPDAWAVPEPYVFARAVVEKRSIETHPATQREGDRLSASLKTPASQATLWYTVDTTAFPERQWQSAPADLTESAASVTLPTGTTAAFFLLQDSEGLRQTSSLVFLQP